MVGSKYYDASSALQVIGGVLNDSSLLDNEGVYTFRSEDFSNDFHRMIFATIHNLHIMGAEQITPKVIENNLLKKPEQLALYRANNGSEWLLRVFQEAEVMNFDYYYKRLKKMTLLRAYDEAGFDVRWIYDPDNIFDTDEREKQEARFDKIEITDIVNMVENKFTRIKEIVVDNDVDESCQIADNVEGLLKELEETPAIGYPLYDVFTNKIVMGARLGK